WIGRIRVMARWKLLHTVSFAATWVVAEQIRHLVPFGGFPWVRIPFSQTNGPLVHLAPIGGAPLVSMVVALMAALGAYGVIAYYHRDVLRTVTAGFILVALGVGPMFIGLDTRAETGEISVGAVQGNVSNPGLDAFANARE